MVKVEVVPLFLSLPIITIISPAPTVFAGIKKDLTVVCAVAVNAVVSIESVFLREGNKLEPTPEKAVVKSIYAPLFGEPVSKNLNLFWLISMVIEVPLNVVFVAAFANLTSPPSSPDDCEDTNENPVISPDEVVAPVMLVVPVIVKLPLIVLLPAIV